MQSRSSSGGSNRRRPTSPLTSPSFRVSSAAAASRPSPSHLGSESERPEMVVRRILLLCLPEPGVNTGRDQRRPRKEFEEDNHDPERGSESTDDDGSHDRERCKPERPPLRDDPSQPRVKRERHEEEHRDQEAGWLTLGVRDDADPERHERSVDERGSTRVSGECRHRNILRIGAGRTTVCTYLHRSWPRRASRASPKKARRGAPTPLLEPMTAPHTRSVEFLTSVS